MESVGLKEGTYWTGQRERMMFITIPATLDDGKSLRRISQLIPSTEALVSLASLSTNGLYSCCMSSFIAVSATVTSGERSWSSPTSLEKNTSILIVVLGGNMDLFINNMHKEED